MRKTDIREKHPRNVRSVEPCIAAILLAAIVEEIMNSGTRSVEPSSNDGSAVARKGNFIVQSFTIKGKQRASPTLGIKKIYPSS